MMAPGHIDAVVRGEGELTLREIVQRDGFAGVAGVSWRSGGSVQHEPDRAQIENMDDVLPPARELLSDRDRYRVGKYRVEGIETSRGCATTARSARCATSTAGGGAQERPARHARGGRRDGKLPLSQGHLFRR